MGCGSQRRSLSSYPRSHPGSFCGNGCRPEKSFNIATLYYRNGTINSGTGTSSVVLRMILNFSEPMGLPQIKVGFTADLINTLNGDDPVASADVVSLRNMSDALHFTDESGNKYYLELSFQVDQDTIDGTLTSAKEFRVFEGGWHCLPASLLGRFTTSPINPVPEPATALLSLAGMVLLLRRKRD